MLREAFKSAFKLNPQLPQRKPKPFLFCPYTKPHLEQVSTAFRALRGSQESRRSARWRYSKNTSQANVFGLIYLDPAIAYLKVVWYMYLKGCRIPFSLLRPRRGTKSEDLLRSCLSFLLQFCLVRIELFDTPSFSSVMLKGVWLVVRQQTRAPSVIFPVKRNFRNCCSEFSTGIPVNLLENLKLHDHVFAEKLLKSSSCIFQD